MIVPPPDISASAKPIGKYIAAKHRSWRGAGFELAVEPVSGKSISESDRGLKMIILVSQPKIAEGLHSQN